MTLRQKVSRIVGAVGGIFCLAAFVREPSFPTPDKLLIFLLLVFMAFGQAIELFKRLFPFVAILLAYESFRGAADQLNSHVNFMLAPDFDKAVFGNLPTVYLQNWLWHGHVQWYDYTFYLAYMLHFILPIGLAILIWKKREKEYWRVVTTYLVVAFAAFLTFFLFPAAPPWMASEQHLIPHIERISSDVWFGLGLKDFPSVYNHISPNPVAAVPSLHAAWATLFALFVFKYFGKKWGASACLYPLLIYIGTVYEAEHYGFDVLSGILYAVAGYLLTPYLMKYMRRLAETLKPKVTIRR